MSIIRWGTEESSVYLIAPVTSPGKVQCICCGLAPDSDPMVILSPPEMIEHLNLHRNKGDTVPDCVFDEITAMFIAIPIMATTMMS